MKKSKKHHRQKQMCGWFLRQGKGILNKKQRKKEEMVKVKKILHKANEEGGNWEEEVEEVYRMGLYKKEAIHMRMNKIEGVPSEVWRQHGDKNQLQQYKQIRNKKGFKQGWEGIVKRIRLYLPPLIRRG